MITIPVRCSMLDLFLQHLTVSHHTFLRYHQSNAVNTRDIPISHETGIKSREKRAILEDNR